MKKTTINKLNTIVLILLVSILNGCVDAEKNKLENRVIDYWNHKINQNYIAAYDFLSPGWKSNEDKDAFERRMNMSKADWKTVKFLNKECSETYLCTVTIEVEYEYIFKEAGGNKVLLPSTLKENWLLQDNIWYYVPIKTKLKSQNL
jgi:hypothetical protein